MNFKKEISEADYFGQKEGEAFAQRLYSKTNLLKEFVLHFLSKDSRFRQRASWVLLALAQNKPQDLMIHMDLFVNVLLRTREDSIKRNILRIFQFLSIPKEHHETLINYCFDILSDNKEATAIQVFSMTVLEELIQPYPELRNELVLLLEANIPFASAGYKSRAKTIIHKKR